MSKRFKAMISYSTKLKLFSEIFYTVDIPTSQFHYEGDVLFANAQETRMRRLGKANCTIVAFSSRS